MPHLHLCNRAGFRDNAAKSGKPGHNRDIGPKSRTVPAKPGHLATMKLRLATYDFQCGDTVVRPFSPDPFSHFCVGGAGNEAS